MMNWRTYLMSVAALATVAAIPSPAAAIGGEEAGPMIITKPGIARAKGGYYTVQRGDTLWDICAGSFGKPWYWPTLWSMNPQITNPHWIYPGDLLQLRGGGGGNKGTLVWSKSRYSQAKMDVEALARWVTYIPSEAVKEAGTLVHAREAMEMLSEFDEVYISFKKDTTVKRGQRFTVYRDEGPVEHPWTGAVVGRKIRQLGEVRVLDAKNDYVKALIIKSYEEIKRGDLLTAALPQNWIVNPVINDRRLLATLIDHNQPVKFGGQWSYVLLDKGKDHGVRRGNRFVIQRRGDGRDEGAEPVQVTDDEDDEKRRGKFPWENIGEMMVVKPFGKTSLAIVTRAIRELSKGERLLMKKGY